jgi:hypothetical protein
LATVLIASACKSSPSSKTSGVDKSTEQSTPADTSNPEERSDKPDISLSARHSQRLWRCAAQKADVIRSKQVSVGPEVLGTIREALTKAEDAEDIYGRRRRNWDTDWNPSVISDWSVGWGHRGLTISGQARSPRDVAEFLQRLQTSDATSRIQFELLESIGSGTDQRISFSFVELTALDSARQDGHVQKILERTTVVLVDDLIEEECAWDATPPELTPPSAFEDASWQKLDEVVAPLHRVYRWRAKVSDAPSRVLERLSEQSSNYGGVKVAPTMSGSTITLYKLLPRNDTDVELPGLTPQRTPPESSIWVPESGCNDELCGVTLKDDKVEQRVRDMLRMSRRAGQLRSRLRAIDRLSARQVSTQAFSRCLAEFVPVARPASEELSPAEHAKQQEEKRVRIRHLRIDEQHYELAFVDMDDRHAANFPDELAGCVESDKAIEGADVPALNIDDEPFAMLIIKAKRMRTNVDLPPWNPKGTNGQRTTIEAFAGPDGPKWREWLRHDIARLQRELLIAREKMPDTLGAPRLLTRYNNVVESFDGSIASLQYVGGAPMGGSNLASHRLTLTAHIPANTMPQLLHAMSRLSRIWKPVLVEYEPADNGPDRLMMEFDVFTHDAR